MDSLEFLARNVGFKGDWSFAVRAPSGQIVYPNDNETTVFQGCYSRIQIQAKRDELTNKPMLEDLPEDAVCIAQDGNGQWFSYSTSDIEPFGTTNAWKFRSFHRAFSNRAKDICKGEVIGDWRDTLEMVNREEQGKGDAIKKIAEMKSITESCTIKDADETAIEFGNRIHEEILEGDSFPARPVNPRYFTFKRSDKAGYCNCCNRDRSTAVIGDSDICESCAESNYLADLEKYATKLEGLLTVDAVEVNELSSTQIKALDLWRTINFNDEDSDLEIVQSERFNDYIKAIEVGYAKHLTCDPLGYND